VFVQGEHRLEHRAVGERAGRLKRLDHLLERQLLVGSRLQRGRAHLGQQVRQGRIGGNPDPQRERVDEEAEQPLQFGGRAVRHRRADDDIVLARQSRQQQRPARQPAS
jgi:hypothetical protein